MAILRIVWITGASFPLLGFGPAGRKNLPRSGGEAAVRGVEILDMHAERHFQFYQQWYEGSDSVISSLW
jgi:hypothetical protein